MTKRELAIKYAFSFIGTAYVWGGNNPLGGWDCSGFVCEILKAVGILSPFEDFSSRDLREVLLARGHQSTLSSAARGAILFFGQSKEFPTHVAISLGDGAMIESGGGGSHTLNIGQAIQNNAFVRVRPCRKDITDVILPNYES